ncbi:hypothetical protein ACJW30_01G139300 [Castanea mollissima]
MDTRYKYYISKKNSSQQSIPTKRTFKNDQEHQRQFLSYVTSFLVHDYRINIIRVMYSHKKHASSFSTRGTGNRYTRFFHPTSQGVSLSLSIKNMPFSPFAGDPYTFKKYLKPYMQYNKHSLSQNINLNNFFFSFHLFKF